MADKKDKIGVVTHYYTHLGVGIIKLDKELRKGTKLQFKGHKTDFEQEISEMQFDHRDIEVAEKGKEVGVKLSEHVRDGDEVFLVE